MNRMIVLPAALFAISTSALSAPHAPSGYNILTCEVKTISLDDGHSLMIGNWKGLVVTVPNSPDHMAQIDCLGTFESMADKSFKANGYCVVTDRDGDKMLDRWWADSTLPKGRWEDTGISGKWKGFRRTGSYVYTDRSTPSECRGVSNWEADR